MTTYRRLSWLAWVLRPWFGWTGLYREREEPGRPTKPPPPPAPPRRRFEREVRAGEIVMLEPTVDPVDYQRIHHPERECEEYGRLSSHTSRWDRARMGEIRVCYCGRLWRCCSAHWQEWERISEERARAVGWTEHTPKEGTV